jgi:hypothetical protein
MIHAVPMHWKELTKNEEEMNFPFGDLEMPPSHYWRRFANQTLQWIDTDTQELWLKNLTGKETREKLIENNWLSTPSIDYSLNSEGFRCDEFTDEEGAIFLGCSITGGVGLPLSCIWPTIVANSLNLRCWNLGTSGGSMDSCFRLLNYYIDKLSTKYVFLLAPSPYRFEMHISTAWRSATPGSTNISGDTRREWYNSSQNAINNYAKNFMAMKYICDYYDIKFYNGDTGMISNTPDNARDLMHPGASRQSLYANTFLNMIV